MKKTHWNLRKFLGETLYNSLGMRKKREEMNRIEPEVAIKTGKNTGCHFLLRFGLLFVYVRQ